MNNLKRIAMRNLLTEVRACEHCVATLPFGPRPVLSAHPAARILIVGQAPGTKVHASGIPWDDSSGNRLREWLGLDKTQFYDETLLAIVPMGFCYPGRGKSGDLPPEKDCAPLWHESLLTLMPKIQLTLLVGRYAQDYYLPGEAATLTERVQRWQDYAPAVFPLPHPSPRNQLWLRRNPWFEQEVIPALSEQVAALSSL